MYALISLWVKLDNPSASKRGGNNIYILQFLQIGFIFKTLITFKLLQSLIFDYNVIQITFLLRLMMKLSK